MTRNEIIREFVRLSEAIHEAEADALVTHEEATIAIDRYRERADAALSAMPGYRRPVHSEGRTQ